MQTWCQVLRSAAPAAQNILANLIWCSRMRPFLGNRSSGLLTHLAQVFVAFWLPCEMHLPRSSSHVPHVPLFWNCYKTFTFCLLLSRCGIPCACHTKRHLNTQKQSEHVLVCTYWLWSVRATRHNGVRFSHIGPHMVWFVQFDLETCFVPHRLFIFHLVRWFCTHRFSEPTFRPSGAANHLKNTAFRDFYLVAHLNLLSSGLLFFDLLFSSFLSSDSSNLCISCVHIVRSLTSKFPSDIHKLVR